MFAKGKIHVLVLFYQLNHCIDVLLLLLFIRPKKVKYDKLQYINRVHVYNNGTIIVNTDL